MPERKSMAGDAGARRWRDIGEAPIGVWNDLNYLPRGEFAKSMGWYPASAILRNGARIDCVAFVEKGSDAQFYFHTQTGFLRLKYEFESNKMIDIRSVASVSASPYKTPLEIQTKMERFRTYERKVTLNDGTEYWLASGGTEEFINVPRGHRAGDVVSVTEASEKDRKYFPSQEFRIWADTSDNLCLGLMYVFLDYSRRWDMIGYDDRAMLCFFKRPKGQ